MKLEIHLTYVFRCLEKSDTEEGEREGRREGEREGERKGRREGEREGRREGEGEGEKEGGRERGRVERNKSDIKSVVSHWLQRLTCLGVFTWRGGEERGGGREQ